MARPAEELLEDLGGKKKLSATELEFMKFFWDNPEGVSSEELYRSFPQTRGTKSTLLYNMSEKGYVRGRQQGRHHIYTALVTREEYEQALLRQQVRSVFGDASIERLLAAFCGKKEIAPDTMARIRALLEDVDDDVDNG